MWHERRRADLYLLHPAKLLFSEMKKMEVLGTFHQKAFGSKTDLKEVSDTDRHIYYPNIAYYNQSREREREKWRDRQTDRETETERQRQT